MQYFGYLLVKSLINGEMCCFMTQNKVEWCCMKNIKLEVLIYPSNLWFSLMNRKNIFTMENLIPKKLLNFLFEKSMFFNVFSIAFDSYRWCCSWNRRCDVRINESIENFLFHPCGSLLWFVHDQNYSILQDLNLCGWRKMKILANYSLFVVKMCSSYREQTVALLTQPSTSRLSTKRWFTCYRLAGSLCKSCFILWNKCVSV